MTAMVLPVFAEPISDRTGLKNSFSVLVGSDSYVVDSVANFDIRSVSFKDNKLVFSINSSLENNLGEIQIPNGITQGDLKFSLDGKEITPKVLKNEKISFATLEFVGNGTHRLEITSDYVLQDKITKEITKSETNDQIIVILAVIGIVVAGGTASTLAVYFKRKRS